MVPPGHSIWPAAARAWKGRRKGLYQVILAPRPTLSMSGWADKYRVLSFSAESGPWRTSRVPYLREIMDACSDPTVERVVVMKSAQVGYTEGILNNTIGYYIDQDPATILAVQPTDEEAEKYSKEKLAPMLHDTPVLGAKVQESRSRNTGTTILAKSFAGGHLGITGATSPRGLRSRSRRILLFDEVDGYPESAGAEGDPIMLGEKRTMTYWNRKIIIGSTPTVKGASRIEKAYAESDGRKYHVPCPHCGKLQVLDWGNRDVDHGLKWSVDADGEPYDVFYLCQHCHACIEESEKPRMVASGQWVAERPQNPVRGYWMNALISLFDGAQWIKLIREFLKVRKDPIRLRVFVNTVLAETWEDIGASADSDVVAERMEVYQDGVDVPAHAAVLTRSVDVQGNRLETAVWGWGAGEESWPVEIEVIDGDPGTPEPWKELDEILTKSYLHESGVRLTPLVTTVDSGYHAKAVYGYCKDRRGKNVFATKGSSQEGTPILGKPMKAGSANVILRSVGSFTGRETLLSRLSKIVQPGPGYVHVPEWFVGEPLKQLTAEKLITVIANGRVTRKWISRHVRNEQTDMWIGALAGLHILGVRFIKGLPERVKALAAEGEKMKEAAKAPPAEETPPAENAPPARAPRRTGWINQWRR